MDVRDGVGTRDGFMKMSEWITKQLFVESLLCTRLCSRLCTCGKIQTTTLTLRGWYLAQGASIPGWNPRRTRDGGKWGIEWWPLLGKARNGIGGREGGSRNFKITRRSSIYFFFFWMSCPRVDELHKQLAFLCPSLLLWGSAPHAQTHSKPALN